MPAPRSTAALDASANCLKKEKLNASASGSALMKSMTGGRSVLLFHNIINIIFYQKCTKDRSCSFTSMCRKSKLSTFALSIGTFDERNNVVLPKYLSCSLLCSIYQAVARIFHIFHQRLGCM